MSTAPLDDVEYGIVADFAALQSRVAAQLTELRARAEAAEQQLAKVQQWPAQAQHIANAGGDPSARDLAGWLAAKVRSLGSVEQPPEPAATLVVTSDNVYGQWAGPSGHVVRKHRPVGGPS